MFNYQTSILLIGGQYCILALAFAFVWWSSRTFFVAGAALIPVAGAMLFTLGRSRKKVLNHEDTEAPVCVIA